MRINHLQLDDQEFEQQFRTCTLSPDLFNHEAHIRLAWIHLKKYGQEQAMQNIEDQLLYFVDNLGARDKFNKTLTIAAIKAVHHFMLKSEAVYFKDFIEEFPRLKYNFKELMSYHYRIDIFNSKKAKTKFLEPDLLPFD